MSDAHHVMSLLIGLCHLEHFSMALHILFYLRFHPAIKLLPVTWLPFHSLWLIQNFKIWRLASHYGTTAFYFSPLFNIFWYYYYDTIIWTITHSYLLNICVFQALNRALSNSFTSVTSLAAFGIAYMIIKLATGLISEVKLVSIMLVHSNADRRKIFLCVLFIGFLVFVFHLLVGMSFSTFANWIVLNKLLNNPLPEPE